MEALIHSTYIADLVAIKPQNVIFAIVLICRILIQESYSVLDLERLAKNPPDIETNKNHYDLVFD